MFLWLKNFCIDIIRKNRGELFFLSTRYSAPFIGLFCNFFVLKFITPKELGIINTVLLIPSYLGILNLGVFAGFGRNFPFYLAQEQKEKAQLIVDAGWLFSKYRSLVGSLITLGVVIYFVITDASSSHFGAIVIIAGMLVFNPLQTFQLRIFIGSQNFLRLGTLLTIHNVITIILGILPAFLGVIGFIIRRALDPVIKFLLLLYKPPAKPSAQGQWREVFELSKVGMPILITGIIYSYLNIADRSVIALFLGTEAVGNFALAGIITTVALFLPASLGMLLYPKAAAKYGRAKSSRGLRRFFWWSLMLNVVLIVPFCLLVYFAIDPVVKMHFPKYVEGIEAAKISALGSIFFISIGVGNIIPIVRRNLPYQLTIGFCLGLIWALGFLFISKGFGIEGVAWARLVANAILCIFTIIFSYYLTTVDIWEE